MKREDLKHQYEQKVSVYRQLEQEALFALKKALKETRIKIRPILSRVKEFDSFADKVNRKEYKNPFEDMQDTVGLRVICLFLPDIERIGNIVHKTFDVISEDNKIENTDFSTFGYMSVHFIVRMRNHLVSPQYNLISSASWQK